MINMVNIISCICLYLFEENDLCRFIGKIIIHNFNEHALNLSIETVNCEIKIPGKKSLNLGKITSRLQCY